MNKENTILLKDKIEINIHNKTYDEIFLSDMDAITDLSKNIIHTINYSFYRILSEKGKTKNLSMNSFWDFIVNGNSRNFNQITDFTRDVNVLFVDILKINKDVFFNFIKDKILENKEIGVRKNIVAYYAYLLIKNNKVRYTEDFNFEKHIIDNLLLKGDGNYKLLGIKSTLMILKNIDLKLLNDNMDYFQKTFKEYERQKINFNIAEIKLFKANEEIIKKLNLGGYWNDMFDNSGFFNKEIQVWQVDSRKEGIFACELDISRIAESQKFKSMPFKDFFYTVIYKVLKKEVEGVNLQYFEHMKSQVRLNFSVDGESKDKSKEKLKELVSLIVQSFDAFNDKMYNDRNKVKDRAYKEQCISDLLLNYKISQIEKNIVAKKKNKI